MSMSNSRESSPDWLRAFKAASTKQSVFTLSSDSDSSPSNSPVKEEEVRQEEPADVKTYRSKKRNLDVIDIGEASPVKKASNTKSPKTRVKTESYDRKKDVVEDVEDYLIGKTPKAKSSKPRVKVESCKHEEDDVENGGESLLSKAPKTKSSKSRANVENQEQKEDDIENGGKNEFVEDETLEKKAGNNVVSRLPLVMSEKVPRLKALVECEGDSIDMSGDIGVVGRVIISDTISGDHEMLLDLKGTIYKTTIVPSRTFCLVSFGQAEAKVEAIMNDFIQLTPQSNVYETETMVEGTLDGFSFDSDEEADKIPKPKANQTDQANDAEGVKKGKTKGKAENPAGVTKKKSKTAVKPAKKGRSKTQAPKKTKRAKK
ncbi:hypothetical protein GIB67_002758 [Kingdonia uniflora]|uniref:DNA-binding protein BIN4 n=1 Tax=Kingdonia uniflora TaxID=39325 RepID=A0A7J7MPN4_9MAGN|nr:hypothetical protein GIB67_002758 [Kingdonia uniflora]